MNLAAILGTACLIIEWTDDPKGWRCDYYLSLPVNDFDHRKVNDADSRIKIEMGDPIIRESADSPVSDGVVDTPLRNGCHIQLDAARLKLPMYAIYGDTITRLEPLKKSRLNISSKKGKPNE